jgi:hypothetical protein
MTGKLIRQSLELLHLELGIGTSPFLLDYVHFGMLATTCWLTSSWEFLSKYAIQLHSPNLPIDLLREHDQYIILCFATQGYSGRQLQLLNKCRLWLQVNTLSDIVTGCGRFILTAAYNGIRNPHVTSQFHWPIQGVLPIDFWRLWQQALDTLCASKGTLIHPLGKWTDTEHCKFFYHPGEERIYEQVNSSWRFYSRIPGRPSRSSRSKFSNREEWLQPLGPLKPATVEHYPTYLKLSGYGDVSSLPKSTLLQFCKHYLPPDTQWLWDHVKFSPNWMSLIDTIRGSHPVYAVSDGSFKDQLGTRGRYWGTFFISYIDIHMYSSTIW